MEGKEKNNLLLTLDRLIPGGKDYPSWEPDTLKGICWAKGACIYVYKNNLYKLIPADNSFKQTRLISLKELNSELEKKELPLTDKLPLPTIIAPDDSIIVLETKEVSVWYDTEKKEFLSGLLLNKEWTNKIYLPFYQDFIYTYKNNLWKISNGESHQLTSEDKPEIILGKAAHRNEWNINKGLFLSPSGKKVAFYRIDTSDEAYYTFADFSLPEKKQKGCSYPFAGKENPPVTIGIIDLTNNQFLYLQTSDSRENFFAGITWSQNEDHLYVTEIARSQQYYRLSLYNTATGDLEKVLLEERSSRYVEPVFNPYPIPLSKNEEGFIWASEKNGWQHLYLHDHNGKEIRPLTKGKWEIIKIIGSDINGNILYLSNESSPLDQSLYSVNPKTSKKSLLSGTGGHVNVHLSNCGKYLLREFTNPQTITQIDWINLDSFEITPVFRAQKPVPEIRILPSANPIQSISVPQLQTGYITASDNITKLYYRICFPPHFDYRQKYPAIQYVYGGPHVQLVNNAWLYNARGWELYMANRGYIIFTLDPRGSEYRGRKFEQSVFRHLGEPTEKDLITGADWLKGLPYIDPKRVGVHGWSFGGYMTLRLLLHNPGYFKAGVAGGAVTNWEWYEIMYTERYMQTPQKNPVGYKKTDLTQKAQLLQDPLLLLHGCQDPVVLPQHLYRFLNACISANKYPELFLYPGHGHNIEGQDRIHLHHVISDFFEKKL
ncbi:MAG: DPP IV N-terminal domain-containing protein [Bacteroidales bacterium]|nr:DPP IV N-terminal domain-containing protein [Bacteroidales bacterium]